MRYELVARRVEASHRDKLWQKREMRRIVAINLVAVTLTFSAQGIDADRRVRQSTDIGWLEHIAAIPGAAEALKTVVSHKNLRTAAYVRLAEIGSPEALAAARRVEEAARKWPLLPAAVSLDLLPHPSGHFGDAPKKPFVSTKSSDGLTYALIDLYRFGGLDAFLITSKTPEDATTWSRPRLLPHRSTHGIVDPVLTFAGPGVLLLEFDIPADPKAYAILRPLPPSPATTTAARQRWEIALADVNKDTDGDGWSDIEEKRLVLDWTSVDTDRDGSPDGNDICPNHAPSPFEGNDEEARILKKVFFAGFGLLYSQDLLLVGGNARPLQFWGSRAPVLVGVDRSEWIRQWNRAPPRVSWNVKSVSQDASGVRTAVVEFSDFVGALAAAGYTATLKHLDGEWFVVKIVMNWIS